MCERLCLKGAMVIVLIRNSLFWMGEKIKNKTHWPVWEVSRRVDPQN